jgi:hypothetical protein
MFNRRLGKGGSKGDRPLLPPSPGLRRDLPLTGLFWCACTVAKALVHKSGDGIATKFPRGCSIWGRDGRGSCWLLVDSGRTHAAPPSFHFQAM